MPRLKQAALNPPPEKANAIVFMIDLVYPFISNCQYRLFPEGLPFNSFQAFTFENDLQDKDSAKKYYMDFLNRFPDHSFANDAKQLLSMIDKSPEELIKEFEAKNAKNVN